MQKVKKLKGSTTEELPMHYLGCGYSGNKKFKDRHVNFTISVWQVEHHENKGNGSEQSFFMVNDIL